MKRLRRIPALYPLLTMVCAVLAASPSTRSESDDQLLLIREAYRDGLLDTAETLAQQYLKDAKKTAVTQELNLILGLISLQNGQTTPAIPFLKKASDGADRSIKSQAFYELGRIHWESRKYSEAAESFSQAYNFSENPNQKKQALYYSAMSQFHSEKWENAIESFTKALKVEDFEHNSQALYSRGISYMKLGRIDEAKLDFQTLAETPGLMDGSNADEVYQILSSLEFESGRYPEADRWAAAYQKNHPDFKAFMMRGHIALKEKRYQQAICWLEQAIGMGDVPAQDIEESKFYIAVSHAKTDPLAGGYYLQQFIFDYPESRFAVAALNELIRNGISDLPPGIIDFIVDCENFSKLNPAVQIDICIQTEHFDRALSIALQTVTSVPSDQTESAQWALIAAILQSNGMLEDSIDLLTRLGSGTENTSLSFLRAKMIFELKDYERAAPLFQEWIINHPEDVHLPEALLWLGESYFQLENWNLCVNIFKRFLEKNDLPAGYKKAALSRLIVCQAKLMQWNETLESFSRFINLPDATQNPPSDIEYYAGLAYANTMKYDEALEHLSQSLDSTEDPVIVENIKSLIVRLQALKNQTPGSSHP